MRRLGAAKPWEMPGLDGLEAAARANRPTERPARSGARRPRRLRAARWIGVASFALVLLAIVPSQSGAMTPSSDSDSDGRPFALAPDRTPLEAASPSAPATATPATPAPTAEARVVDLPAFDGSVAEAAALDLAALETSGTNATAITPGNASRPTTGSGVRPAIVAGSDTDPDPSPTATPPPAAGPGTFRRDLFDAALVRYQNPDRTACTAASTVVMLNLIARHGSPGGGFVWQPTVSYAQQESILAWERANDTLDAGAKGSDPHGWRNALNHYGWNNVTDPGTRAYEDLAYTSFESAVKAAVVAIARENRPVGILGWAGGHAQIMTGYEVFGQDPATSTDFDVLAVYLTDPLYQDNLLHARIATAEFAGGSTRYRFDPYAWTDSAADDPYTPGRLPSYEEWLGKWVIVAPVGASSASPAVALP